MAELPKELAFRYRGSGTHVHRDLGAESQAVLARVPSSARSAVEGRL